MPTYAADKASAASIHLWWTQSGQESVRLLDTDSSQGLSSVEAANRLRQYGRNLVAEEPPPSIWRRVWNQLNVLMVWILLAATGVAAWIGDVADATAILAIVALNVAIGVFQEERASRALAALRKSATPTARLIRDGSLVIVPVGDVVPGDIIQLEAGDQVAADARLLTTYGVRTQESTLTGESTPVDKDPELLLAANSPLADRANMAFMGTAVATGRAHAVVVATGMHTEIGQIAGLLQRFVPEPTPLQRRLTELGRGLVAACLVIVGVVFALNLYRGGAFVNVLLLSISLAVAAVPEGLPTVVTLTLVVGLRRMVKRNALIRRLTSVETLGAVTVICSDKTGTLTRNEMTAREVYAGNIRYEVTGAGYEPSGEFHIVDAQTGSEGASNEVLSARHPVNASSRFDLIRALEVAAFCNNASLHEPSAGQRLWSITGDPTEAALLVLAAKAGIRVGDCRDEKLHEIPFDSDRKAMSVVLRHESAPAVMYTKGALEAVLPKCSAELIDGGDCPLSDVRRGVICHIGADMASKALRVLALARREHARNDDADYPENNLTFTGLVGLSDPPRDNAIAAVRLCREAGIRPVMITGDQTDTAFAIAREVGITRTRDEAVSGVEIDELSEEELARKVASISVYARVSAQHKLRVVKAWQSRGEIVAMTGDGVNDAPAIKAADIGITMGLKGSDVTKESADMVLTDDNFATIVNAIEEGRGIYANIQKVVHYLLACNAGEILLMLVAGIIGWPAPLRALQILWINLVTDGLPALALGMEPPEPGVMQRPPRQQSTPFVTWSRGLQIIRHAILMAVTAAAMFWWIYDGRQENLPLAQSVTFYVVAYMQLFYSFSSRSRRQTMPQLGPFTNPYLLGAIVASCLIQLAVLGIPATRAVFGLDERVLEQWLLIMMGALAPVTAIELSKLAKSSWRSAA